MLLLRAPGSSSLRSSRFDHSWASVALAAMISLITSAPASATWWFEHLGHHRGDISRDVEIAPNGTVHLTAGRTSLMKTVTGWQETDLPSFLNACVRIEITDSGVVHAIAPDHDTTAHRLFVFDGLSWTEWSSVDFGPTHGCIGLDFVLDSDGEPHVLFVGLNTEDVFVAHHAAGEWVVEPVDNLGEHSGASIAIDVEDGLHVAYVDRPLGQLRYAYREASGWMRENVAAMSDGLTSIAVGSDGRPRITCAAQLGSEGDDERTLTFHARGDAGWDSETIYTPVEVTFFDGPVLLLDSTGEPRILARRPQGGPLDGNADLLLFWLRDEEWRRDVLDRETIAVAATLPPTTDQLHIVAVREDGILDTWYGSGQVPVAVEAMPAPPVTRWRTWPVPASRHVRIRTDATAATSLEIFDATGRHVITVPDQDPGVGFSAVWDGADTAGRPLPTGVYFARPPGEADTMHLVLDR